MDDGHLRLVQDESDFDQARILFLEYMDVFGLDLEYFDFDLELSTLEHIYIEPDGFIFLYSDQGEDNGVVAFRKYDEGVIELKRMFLPEACFSNQEADRVLSEAIEKAQSLKYHRILLDVLPEMTKLVSLYERLGFFVIPPFRFDPIPRTLFMKKDI